jgi:hypothetical protein
MLSAYLSDDRLVSIFGTDMLNDESMQGILDQLTGIQDDDPAGCAGTQEEVNTAIAMSIRNHEHNGTALPVLYQNYIQTSYYEYYRNKEVDWTQFNHENLVPEEYQNLLKQWLEEMKNR